MQNGWQNPAQAAHAAISQAKNALAELLFQDVIGAALVANAHDDPTFDHVDKIAAQRFWTDVGTKILVLTVGDAAIGFQEGKQLLNALVLGRQRYVVGTIRACLFGVERDGKARIGLLKTWGLMPVLLHRAYHTVDAISQALDEAHIG